VELTFASYNIHKAVGTDRLRNPDRILSVLREIDADVIALQEADQRFGERASVLPRQTIDDHTPWQAVPLAVRPESIGWHGNALLVRRGITIRDAGPVPLPTLEPRGAVFADLEVDGQPLTVVGMHLDLSGLRRRHQVRAVMDFIAKRGSRHPAVLMGDFNQWRQAHGAMREFDHQWTMLNPGRSFPSRQPLAPLDRIVISPEWHCLGTGVHHSLLASRASDHLPVFARLTCA
jgi:endonuclease/exonuclease/phosphatase family metal-dependent hydrolase